MARIRSIKPEFWTAEQVMELSPMARLLFIGLWNFCDDKGVHPVAYKTLKAEVFPADDLLSSDVERMIGELIRQGLLSEFEADGRQWWYVTGWHHQVINRPSKSRYPEPPRFAPPPSAAGHGSDESCVSVHDEEQIHGRIIDDSLSYHATLTDGREEEGEGKGREGKNLPQLPPPARDGSFPMDLSWEPSQHFPTLAHQAGIPQGSLTDETLAEFRSYWFSQPGTVRTQHEWDHSLLKNLKASKLREGHPPRNGGGARASPSDHLRAKNRAALQEASAAILAREGQHASG